MKKPSDNQSGFTLIELMIVVVILGILAAIATPNYIRIKDGALRGSCISNQRNLVEAGLLYALETNAPDGVINVTDLAAANYIVPKLGECPSSNNGDNDDYELTLLGLNLIQVDCTIEPVAHDYDPPTN